ncbi:MAG: 2-oxoglutarate dehydrogenase, E2 component, dihydrolipoamide succinyltransferase [Angustibacter sp.]
MSERVKMPALGESVTEGTVTRWLKQVGDQVEVDEPLLEVSTDKVDTEVPSPVAGTLREVLVGEDETVPVGADLAVVGDAVAGEAMTGGSIGGDTAEQLSPLVETSRPPIEPERPGWPQSASSPAGSSPTFGQADATPLDRSSTIGTSAAVEAVATIVRMPALGESVTEGTVTRWLKQVGDQVEVDEPLLEVSTDKVDTEVPSPVAGTVRRVLVREDETVPVGADLAEVGGADSATLAEAHGAGTADLAGVRDVEGGSAGTAPPVERRLDPAPSDRRPSSAAASSPHAPQPGGMTDAGAPDWSTGTPRPLSASAVLPEGRPTESTGTAPPPVSGTDAPSRGPDPGVYVTPLVRKLATDLGVDLTAVSGTGVGGRVRKQDILDKVEASRRAAETSSPAPATAFGGPGGVGPVGPSGRATISAVSAKRGTTEKMGRLRRLIAQRMVESLQTAAQLTTVVEVDVTKIARLRARARNDFQAREGVKLSFLPFFAQAAVEALKVHPVLNASIDNDEVTYHAQENLGIAVDTDKGLIVPVIREAGDLNIAGIARKISDLAERTRASSIGPDELGGGTFTLTNTGSRGALFDTPIINQPQVAILGTGSVVKRPVVVTDADGGETIAIRSMVYLALSYDHRIVDGADAARFLTTVKERLEEGAFEADLGV